MMAFDITQQLKQTYAKATLEREALKNLNSEEWKELKQIKKKFDGQRTFEQRSFEMEFKTRVEVARKRLINEAGKKNVDYKHKWFGADRFDKSAIFRQADRQVRNAHSSLLGHLEKKELEEIDAFLERSDHRQKLRNKPMNDFARAADRRQGDERRLSPSRKRER